MFIASTADKLSACSIILDILELEHPVVEYQMMNLCTVCHFSVLCYLKMGLFSKPPDTSHYFHYAD